MNLIFDALHSTFDAAEQRMDDAGIPKIVRERCPNPRCVNGAVEVRNLHSAQISVQRCTTCVGAGTIRVEGYV